MHSVVGLHMVIWDDFSWWLDGTIYFFEFVVGCVLGLKRFWERWNVGGNGRFWSNLHDCGCEGRV